MPVDHQNNIGRALTEKIFHFTVPCSSDIVTLKGNDRSRNKQLLVEIFGYYKVTVIS